MRLARASAVVGSFSAVAFSFSLCHHSTSLVKIHNTLHISHRVFKSLCTEGQIIIHHCKDNAVTFLSRMGTAWGEPGGKEGGRGRM